MVNPIPRNPTIPELTNSEMDTIEKLVFWYSEPQPSDILFIFGSTRDQWSDVATLCKKQITPSILITGKAGLDSPASTRPQSHMIRDELTKSGVDPQKILIEDASTNTKENVVFSKNLLEKQGMYPKSILFTCKTHHSGRCYRTLKQYFPTVRFSCFTYDGIYNGIVVSKNNWRNTAYARERIYGEYLRIQRYISKGDIAP